jgi:hypothetical protein
LGRILDAARGGDVTTEQRRVFGLGGLTLLLTAGSLYLLWPVSTEPPRRDPAVSPPPARTEPAPPPPSAAPEPVREASLSQVPPQQLAEAPRTPDLPLDPRERLKALQPLRREVVAGLADLAGRVEACSLRDANIFLTLETLEGRVRVLEVRVMSAGAGTGAAGDAEPVARDDGAARCVRGALERTIISAPSARPGRQWEMPWGPGMVP